MRFILNVRRAKGLKICPIKLPLPLALTFDLAHFLIVKCPLEKSLHCNVGAYGVGNYCGMTDFYNYHQRDVLDDDGREKVAGSFPPSSFCHPLANVFHFLGVPSCLRGI